MKSLFTSSFRLLAVVSYCTASTFVHKFDNECNEGADEIDGNWYCVNSVQAVTYTGFQQTGAYSRVISMENSQCAQQSQNFDSPLGSFGTGNDVSWHFRGPIQLNEFAYYALATSSGKKRSSRPTFKTRRHSHARYHQLKKQREIYEIEKRHIVEIQKRDVCDPVTATFGTVVATWLNLWDGKTNLPSSVCSTATQSSSQETETETSTIYTGTTTITISVVHASSTESSQASTPVPSLQSPSTFLSSPKSSSSLPPPPAISSSSDSSAPSPTGTGSPTNSGQKLYSRKGYYNATSQNNTGIVFLNHMGGQGSGVWDADFGNSLSYASSDGQSGAASPEIFSGNLTGDTELVIFSSTECDASGSLCGYTRPGTVAHQGFDSPESLFLLDFTMPMSLSAEPNITADGQQQQTNASSPAIWLLNAQIPRTLQYGPPTCSCWSTGCGELDLFEVLDAGETRMKATWHGDRAGGSSYWFERPTTQSRRAGVLLSEGQGAAMIFWVPDGVDFAEGVEPDVVEGWISAAAAEGSLFTL